MPKSALEDTHVLRGGTADSSGAAKSSTWLLKAGERGLAVDVQVWCPDANTRMVCMTTRSLHAELVSYSLWIEYWINAAARSDGVVGSVSSSEAMAAIPSNPSQREGRARTLIASRCTTEHFFTHPFLS